MEFSRGTFALILTSVSMSAAAQLCLKKGMSGGDITASLGRQQWGDAVLRIATAPWVVGGLTLYFLSAAVWMLVLARVEVSFAYPFVGIGFILTMLLGWRLMGDTLSVSRIAGTLLIVAGVVLIARNR